MFKSWFSSSPTAAEPAPLPSQAKSQAQGEACEKPKPCCVCKPEKASRDECMLYSQADDPQEDCKGLVVKYKECMAGYGFKI